MTALLLSAALVLAQQPPQAGGQPPQQPQLPPAPATAPQGLAPQFGYAVADGGGKLSFVFHYPEQKTELRDVKVRGADGRETVTKQQVVVHDMKAGLAPLDEKFSRITTTDGKPVTYADAAKRVGAGAVVVMWSEVEGRKVDPAFLKALKPETLVIEMLHPTGPEAAPPAKKP